MLAELLKLYRRVYGKSTREMAEMIGFSASTYNRIENGKGIDSASMMRMLQFLFEPGKTEKGENDESTDQI